MSKYSEKNPDATPENVATALAELEEKGIGSKHGANAEGVRRELRKVADEKAARANRAPQDQGRGRNTTSDRDERFGDIALAVSKAALAHRGNDEQDEKEANEQAKVALTKAGLEKVENPFTNPDFKMLLGYIQEAILDPRVKVNGSRVPLGALRALQNVTEAGDVKAMNAFTKQRYDTTGLLLKAQSFVADAHNGNERSVRVSPGGLDWMSRQLRRIAEEMKNGEGFDAQRRQAGYEDLSDKVDNLKERLFSSPKRVSTETDKTESASDSDSMEKESNDESSVTSEEVAEA